MIIIRPNSIRIKMGVLSTVVLGSILILYSLYLYFQLQDVLYSNLDAELKIKAHELGKTIKAFQDTKSPGGDIHYAAIKVLSFDVNMDQDGPVALADQQWFRLINKYDLYKDYISVLSLGGQFLAQSANMPPELQDQFAGLFTKHHRIRSTWDSISYNGKKLRVLQMMMFARDKPHYLIQIATPMTTVNQLLQNRLWGIVISIPVVMILFSMAGFMFANHILHPVRKITEAAERLTHEDLSQRVKVTHVDSEMLFLVNAFNKMIERLETSFKQMASIIAYIAHELKTPLAIIRGEGQTILYRQEQSPEQYRDVIQSSIMETERMLRVIDDLLITTNISYNKEIFHIQPIKLTQFLEDIYQKSQILAEPKNIHIDFRRPERDITINGDSIHLRRFFFNLIDNAIKYSSPGSVVKIFTKLQDDGIFISVQDEGEGIAPDDLPYIFEHTFQKKPHENENDRKPVRSGLGLHLCRAIAEAHHGKIIVDSKPGEGSTFSLFLSLKK
ncbi:MAG: HAMP domain-containing protein [wastewater metagenome]|nr:HAMP domain-containing protein [Candidatus Loosdrechtia aerotolerans]